MRKLLVFPAILIAFGAAQASAQAVSGGQAPQNGATINTNPYNSTNVGDQYTQRRQSDNLPEQRASNASVSKMGPARPATASELSVGANVNDLTGVLIAKIDQIDPDGVILSSDAGKLKIPANAFGHNKAGLLLDMTKAQFDQIVEKANAAS
jgi:hypothetical protein